LFAVSLFLFLKKFAQMKLFISNAQKNEEFEENFREMSKLIAQLESRLGEAQYQGEPRHVERFKKEGKLLARERIELLLDDDTPYLEICALAGFGQDEGNGSTAIGGVGMVCGVLCVISSNVPTIRGGTVNPQTMLRLGRLGQIAMENRLPVIRLTESGGADLRGLDDNTSKSFFYFLFLLCFCSASGSVSSRWRWVLSPGSFEQGGDSPDLCCIWQRDGRRRVRARDVGLHNHGAKAGFDVSWRPAPRQDGNR
jgi:hypothetical protein